MSGYTANPMTRHTAGSGNRIATLRSASATNLVAKRWSPDTRQRRPPGWDGVPISTGVLDRIPRAIATAVRRALLALRFLRALLAQQLGALSRRLVQSRLHVAA